MSKLTIITDRAMELAGQAGAGLRHAGSSVRHAGHNAEHWIRTGAALGTARAGARAAGKVVRRNPVAVAAAAAVVGAGVLAYVLYRKRREQQHAAPLDGQAQRIEKERDGARPRPRRSRAAAD
ncbi:hypothetical protein [Pseudoxanthomonas koreensis]|uniref:hypothetical protein n=1 Tax=Pseudoxanthomonas koreensis TaxID=266061 RepID=UPI0035A640E1